MLNDINTLQSLADAKLDQMRQDMLLQDATLVTALHYQSLQKLLNSPLYECLKMMPKPAIHHTHLTACADKNLLLKLTYFDYVYYSDKENVFWVGRNTPP